MSKYFILFKTLVAENLNLGSLFKIKSKRKTTVLIFSILLFLVILGSIFAMVYGMASILKEINAVELLFSMALLGGTFITFMSVLTKSNDYLFKSKDGDQLFSFPLKNSTIVLAKFSLLTLLSYISFAVLYIPVMIVYPMFVAVPWTYYPASIIVYLLTPLVFIVIGSLIAYLLGLIFINFKYKNALAIFGYMVMLVGIFTFNMLATTPESIGNAFGVMGVIAKYMFPLEWAIRIINGEWIWFIPFFLINALSVVVFILVTLKYYKRVFLKINQQQRSNVFKDEHINVEKKGIIRVLLAREFKKYFSFPAYVMNTIMSPLMSIIMTVVLYLQLRNAVDGPSVEFITLILVAINAFIGGMTPTTSVSLSLEGKEFWILKSSPIKPASVFIAKILMNVILFGVGSVVVAVILFAFMGLNILSSILVLITLLLSVLFASMAGILANLLLPKMNFDQPIKVVKQSMSVLVSMVVGLIATALAAGLGFIGFKNTQNIDITLGSAIAVYILLSLIVGLVLKYIGPKLYRKLEA